MQHLLLLFDHLLKDTRFEINLGSPLEQLLLRLLHTVLVADSVVALPQPDDSERGG